MYVYFDKNGTIKEVINDLSIRKGSAEANKIYVYVDDTEIDDIWFVAKKPDGTLTTEQSFINNVVNKAVPYDAKRDLYYFKDFEIYKFYVFTLTANCLDQSGLIVATIRISKDNSIFALGELTFNVQENVVKDDNGITQSQYDYLLLAYASRTLSEQTGSDLDTLLDDKIEAEVASQLEPIEDELNDKIDAQNATIASLSQASPSVFDTTAHIQVLQENKGVAVATDTGYIWFWDTTLTPNAYSNSNIQYNSLANYVKHSGNQLQDANGNNFYPNIADGSITPEKTAFEVQSINLGSLLYCDNGSINLGNNLYVEHNDNTFTYKITTGASHDVLLLDNLSHFKLEAGKTYTLAIFGDNLPSSNIGGIYVYDNTRNANITISSGTRAIALHGASGHSITFTSTYDVNDGVLNFLCIANVTFNFTFNLMLVEGSTPPTQYKKPIRYIDEGSYHYFTNLISNLSFNVQIFINLAEIKNKYRYLIPTFLGTPNATNSLILLGSNDLHTFDLLKQKGCFIIDGNVSSAEFIRDPAIIQIGDYFYMTYSISMTSNKIGMCRTKDFATFETLADLTITNSNSDIYNGAWAPCWFKENDKYYIVVSGKISQGYFDTLLLEYNPNNHTLGTGYKLLENQGGVIDGHIYRDNGHYYLITNSGNRYKSDTLLSQFTFVTGLTNLPYTEGEFAIKLDNGKWRIYAQSLTSGGLGTQEMYYIDVNTLEDNLGVNNLKICNYTTTAQNYASNNLPSGTVAHYWHWTIFDFNNRNDNNNNFIN